MKEKALALLMVFLFIVAFSGCEGGKSGNPTEPTTSTSGDSDLIKDFINLGPAFHFRGRPFRHFLPNFFSQRFFENTR